MYAMGGFQFVEKWLYQAKNIRWFNFIDPHAANNRKYMQFKTADFLLVGYVLDSVSDWSQPVTVYMLKAVKYR